MYTSSINSAAPQAVGTQSASEPAIKTTEAREGEILVQPKDQDTYTPSAKKEEDAGIYSMDVDTVNKMKTELENHKLRFFETVKKILGNQIQYGQGAWKNISPEDQAAAQEAISEDGYWGVKQTSERIVAFAKALVGGDPSRVEEMRAAFVKGYEAAEKAWGGALPDISKQTYDAAMKLFDEWAGKTDKGDSAGKAEETAPAQPEESE